MSKPVVVPTTLANNLYKKVEPTKEIDTTDFDIDDEITDDVQMILEQAPKRRGRPRKNPPKEIQETAEEQKPKRRGRPRKNPVVVEEEPEEDFENNILPGFEDIDTDNNNDDDNNNNNDYDDFNDTNILPGFEDTDLDDEINNTTEDYEPTNNDIYNNSFDSIEEDNDDYFNNSADMNSNFASSEREELNNKYMRNYDNVFDDEEFEGLLSKEKKVVSFVGTSKNGTSFIINNVALILSNMGIDTAILDATSNKNAFYIYTQNDDDLRRIAVNSFENLKNETAEGIKVNNNLTVYTTIPSKNEQINDSRPILETLIRNHSLILIDTDFSTPVEYFEKSQEIYVVQTMDVLTIQPLTEFLRELKVKNVLDERKIRIVLNKLLNVRGISAKSIIGGMSNYNDPEMSFMTELFNRNTVKLAAQIPFDEDVYIKYLSNLIECNIQVNKYPKEFRQKLTKLAEMIYPLLPGKTIEKKGKRNTREYSSSFSPGMNSTLDNMRKKY